MPPRRNSNQRGGLDGLLPGKPCDPRTHREPLPRLVIIHGAVPVRPRGLRSLTTRYTACRDGYYRATDVRAAATALRVAGSITRTSTRA